MSVIETIAREAGVSPRTVSNVLNRKNKETWPAIAERAARIRQVAARHDYMPNAAARAVRSGRFSSAALVYRANNTFFSAGLFSGVCDALAANDMHMTFVRMPEILSADDGQVLPKAFREMCVDGLLFDTAHDIPKPVMSVIRRQRIPAIWLNAREEADCVYPDELEASARLTRMLIERGHRRIAFAYSRVSWPDAVVDAHFSWADRYAGYAGAMAEAGLAAERMEKVYAVPLNALPPWGTSQDDRLARAMAVLRRADRPTAIVSPDPDSAGPFVQAAALLGLAVPGDLSVATINHERVAHYGQSLSMMVTPMVEVGRQSVQQLLRKTQSLEEALAPLAVPFTQMEGNTIGDGPNE